MPRLGSGTVRETLTGTRSATARSVSPPPPDVRADGAGGDRSRGPSRGVVGIVRPEPFIPDPAVEILRGAVALLRGAFDHQADRGREFRAEAPSLVRACPSPRCPQGPFPRLFPLGPDELHGAQAVVQQAPGGLEGPGVGVFLGRGLADAEQAHAHRPLRQGQGVVVRGLVDRPRHLVAPADARRHGRRGLARSRVVALDAVPKPPPVALERGQADRVALAGQPGAMIGVAPEAAAIGCRY